MERLRLLMGVVKVLTRKAQNKMKLTLLLFTLLSIVCGVRITDGQPEAPPYTDVDAYDVYSVLLRRSEPADKTKPRRYVIQAETEDYPSFGEDKTKCLIPAKGEEATYAPVIEAYRNANEKTWSLQPKFADYISYQIVPAASIKGIFDKGSWSDFYKTYPKSGGYIMMSAVGFNSDKTIAIVYMGSACGGLCGSGSYRVLRKTDGQWSEIKWMGIVCIWQS